MKGLCFDDLDDIFPEATLGGNYPSGPIAGHPVNPILAAANAEAAAEALSARAKRQDEREAAQTAWRVQQDAAQAEAAQRKKAERDALIARFAADDAERAERASAIETARTTLEQQDADYHAYAVKVGFYIDAHDPAGSDTAVSDWALADDENENAELIARVTPQVINAISPWLTHFSAIGLVRADALGATLMSGLVDAGCDPTFYLICSAEVAAAGVLSLAEFTPATLALEALPGATLHIKPRVSPVNASLLVKALRNCVEPVGPWGGALPIAGLPALDESRVKYLRRAALVPAKATRLVGRWRRSGGNLALFGTLGSADERASGNQKIEWLIEGRIPRGYVTLLVGNNASGKSSAAHAIAAALGSPEATARRVVFGAEVTGEYEVAIISGEDGEGIINHRAAAHATIWGESSYFVIDGVGVPLEDVLKMLELTPRLDLLIIDPVRAFLDGDEDSSAIVSRFYDRLTRLARDKNCAVIAVHHLTKARPRRLSDMLPMVRGSGVHTDRARLVIGMIYRGNSLVEIGPIKSNLPGLWTETNIGQVYARDASTFTLRPVASNDATPPTGGNDDCAEDRVLSVIRKLNAASAIVRRTGKSGLFEARAADLKGMSRSAILSAIAALLDAGTLVDGEEGLIVVSAPAPSSGVA